MRGRKGNIAYGIFFVLVLALVFSTIYLLFSVDREGQIQIGASAEINTFYEKADLFSGEIKDVLKGAIVNSYFYYSEFGKYIDDDCESKKVEEDGKVSKYYILCGVKKRSEIEKELTESVLDNMMENFEEQKKNNLNNDYPENIKKIVESIEKKEYNLEFKEKIFRFVARNIVFKDEFSEFSAEYTTDVKAEASLSELGFLDFSELWEAKEECRDKINNLNEYTECWEKFQNFDLSIKEVGAGEDSFYLIKLISLRSDYFVYGGKGTFSVSFLIRK